MKGSLPAQRSTVALWISRVDSICHRWCCRIVVNGSAGKVLSKKSNIWMNSNKLMKTFKRKKRRKIKLKKKEEERKKHCMLTKELCDSSIWWFCDHDKICWRRRKKNQFSILDIFLRCWWQFTAIAAAARWIAATRTKIGILANHHRIKIYWKLISKWLKFQQSSQWGNQWQQRRGQ